MKIYVAFDDTDTIDCGRGTGKLARWFEQKLPDGCTQYGIMRQQLLVAPDIPYTSHNSSLINIIEAPDESYIPELITIAAAHIMEHFVVGSDPGLCVVSENNPAIKNLIPFGITCMERKVSQQEAMTAAEGIHLSGHGGTNDGIIGAAAGVGLTYNGMSGRFNEYSFEYSPLKLRDYPAETTAGFLRDHGISVMSVDKNCAYVPDADIVQNFGWLRPNLSFGKPAVFVMPDGKNRWMTYKKVKHNAGT